MLNYLFVILAVSIPNLANSSLNCETLKDGMREGVIVKVADGDTASLKISSSNQIVQIRFYGVDTPESKWTGKWPAQAYSSEAKQFTKSKLLGQKVLVNFNGGGTHNRCVGEIFINGSSHSLNLIGGGYGWWYKRFSRQRLDFKHAQESASLKRKGLWADSDPDAPWDYRRSYRSH